LSARRDILLALLMNTKDTPIELSSLSENTRVTDEALNIYINILDRESLVDIDGDQISASLNQRLQLAVKAVQAGADLERISRSLGWLEFEEFVAFTFEENGYKVMRRFRFNADGRRWEIDVLALRNSLVVCVECKHWSKGLGNMTARRIVESHLEKVKVLSQNFSEAGGRVNLDGWRRATFVPITLSLQPATKKIYRRMPVVSVFELPRFINEFEGQMDWLTSFKIDLPPPRQKMNQIKLTRKKKSRKG